jgi:hypothetical protein
VGQALQQHEEIAELLRRRLKLRGDGAQPSPPPPPSEQGGGQGAAHAVAAAALWALREEAAAALTRQVSANACA